MTAHKQEAAANEGSTQSSEQRLWLMVIRQAIIDATIPDAKRL